MSEQAAERPAKRTVREQQAAEYDVLLPEFQKQARDLLKAEGRLSRKCDCGKWVHVATSEIKGWLELWKWYHQTVVGTPGKAPDAPVEVDAGTPIGELSDEDLRRLAGSGE